MVPKPKNQGGPSKLGNELKTYVKFHDIQSRKKVFKKNIQNLDILSLLVYALTTLSCLRKE